LGKQAANVCPRPVRGRVGRLHVDPGGADATPADRLSPQPYRLRARGVDRPLHGGYRHAGVDQGCEQHVAGNTRRTVQPTDHRCSPACLATRAAWTPAPNPLSMFTTTTPGAHEFSMASRAARPPSEAP